MNEFSDVGSVLSDINTLKLSKALSSHLEYNYDENDKESLQKSKERRGTSINVLLDVMQKNESILSGIGNLNFNIFSLAQNMDRE